MRAMHENVAEDQLQPNVLCDRWHGPAPDFWFVCQPCNQMRVYLYIKESPILTSSLFIDCDDHYDCS